MDDRETELGGEGGGEEQGKQRAREVEGVWEKGGKGELLGSGWGVDVMLNAEWGNTDLVVDVAEDEADDGITTAVTIFLGATGCNTLTHISIHICT